VVQVQVTVSLDGWGDGGIVVGVVERDHEKFLPFLVLFACLVNSVVFLLSRLMQLFVGNKSFNHIKELYRNYRIFLEIVMQIISKL
jgi:hypothetical protein